MIYKNCIDACFDVVKAAERCTFDCNASPQCPQHKTCCMACAEICTLVGRLTARGCCTKDFYEMCIKVCEDCQHHCGSLENKNAQDCAAAAKRCAEACRPCLQDC